MNKKLSGFLPSLHRAVILRIFCSYFGRNDDFINSFRNCLTFNKFILSSRLIGPPKDWASSQVFIQANEESIYGKLLKNNMDVNSFYPFEEGIDYVVNSDTEVALFHFQDINSFEKYHCKVKTSKTLLLR